MTRFTPIHENDIAIVHVQVGIAHPFHPLAHLDAVHEAVHNHFGRPLWVEVRSLNGVGIVHQQQMGRVRVVLGEQIEAWLHLVHRLWRSGGGGAEKGDNIIVQIRPQGFQVEAQQFARFILQRIRGALRLDGLSRHVLGLRLETLTKSIPFTNKLQKQKGTQTNKFNKFTSS